MIARCAIRSGFAASPRSAGIIARATAWKVNAACAALPFLRTWYNDCTLCNPKRLCRFDPLCGDYTGSHGLESKCRMRGASFPARVV